MKYNYNICDIIEKDQDQCYKCFVAGLLIAEGGFGKKGHKMLVG